MTMTVDTSIHRALDRAFAGAPDSAEAQDLKEEVRASLMARAAALEATGLAPAEAAARALAEWGDLHDVVADLAGSPQRPAAVTVPRVRPRPSFVVRVALVSVAAAAAVAAMALVAAGVLDVPLGITAALAVAAGLTTGTVVADSLRQETTTNHPLPTGRALGFGAATVATVTGLGLATPALAGDDRLWPVLVAGGLVVAGLVGFLVLGTTQTNRHKAWTVEAGRQVAGDDRFSREPEVAARFGVYTVVLALVAVLAFVVLTMTVGLAWSWLAPAVAVPVFFLLLARMLFRSGDRPA